MGQEDTENISYIIDGTGPDGKAEIGTDDLKQDVKMTVAHYLHSLTTEAPTANKYSVPDGLAEGSLTDANGNPADIQTGGPYRESAFSLDPTLDQYSNPFLDAFAEEIRVRDYLTKGENGNTLLQDVNGEAVNRTGKATAEDGDTPVQKQVSQVLRSNRFNPTPGSTPYVTGDKVPDPPRVIPNESSLGAYRDPETGQLLATVISIDELRKTGLSLMLRASGDDLGDPSDPDKVTGLLPSGIQLGVGRVDPAKLEARNAYPLADVSRSSLQSDFPRPAGDLGSRSYGNLNNYLEPFDSFVPTGMVTLAGASVVATWAIMQSILALVNEIADKAGKSKTTGAPAPGTYVLGQSSGKKDSASAQLADYFLMRAFNFSPTKNDFGKCVSRGINVFFGMTGEKKITAEDIAKSAINVLTAPGYYAIHMRAIYRSAVEFGIRASEIDFSNPAGGIQQIIGMLDLVRTSKVVSFINVCASLGDLAITLESKGYRVDPESGEILKVSDMDSFPSRIAGATVKKSRTEKNLSNIALSWRTSSSRSALLVPGGLLSKVVKQNDSVNRRLGGLAAISDYAAQGSGNGNRIAPDEVRRIESALDSEYVPFYFHDLRTNEILSFHAFLTSLNDNFTANYDAVDGYGRIDPVQIYRSTNREISLGFFVASTSREDFDVMWWKINKLVTLVYPQWSSGRNVKTNGGTSFTQPFSQIPTASPLVRMRVGDVVRSNYSKFNLKRLFGNVEAANAPETSNAQAGGQSDTAYGSVLNQFGADVNGAKSTIANNPQGQKFLLRPRGYGLPYRRRNGDRVSLVTDKEITVTVQEKVSDNVFVVSVEDLSIDDLMVTINDLRYDPTSLISATTSAASEDNEQAVNEIATDAASFFSADSNPIVRAFESTAGKGLAGVIKTINFNWFEPTWEIDSGAKAPQWCRIEMSFSPIHDIPPGLDDEGFNRAPVYPVGAVSNFVFSEDEVDAPPAAVEQPKDASNGDAEETIMQIATEIALRQAGVI
jgi:hypothetical protein